VAEVLSAILLCLGRVCTLTALYYLNTRSLGSDSTDDVNWDDESNEKSGIRKYLPFFPSVDLKVGYIYVQR
jgi:hypothetical protein